MQGDKSFSSLGSRIDKINKKLQKSFEQLVKVAALSALRTAAETTPVDTGNARTNWNVSVGSSYTSKVDQLPSGVRVKAKDATKMVLSKGQPKIKSFRLRHGLVWITNSVGYIKGLDTGNVSKKGGNMSAKAVVAAIKAVKKTARNRNFWYNQRLNRENKFWSF